ncbi:hypothetical protein M409DRAFT_30415 [Zasmidium cellare ATCC 36951]|uniref:Uncharacterized protein n=1 Tax=Zasmidium cellare ATCC 36951 TaxID=1080233 RepID=A0A6A6BX22_ZASCE|nr:uncharacterized protein M409DRAFT_30415 [Zasmidium cellare ATCC 36951]KAF2159133.1 hypothetical protein M409DRAFT_30415 [Zasmidium cellare ATCC 36951]
MDHHRPHPTSVFEGYYSKFSLPSGAHLALVICKIRGAPSRSNMVSFTYVPRNGKGIYQKEIWADSLQMVSEDDSQGRAKGKGFILNVPNLGFAKWDADGRTTEYELWSGDFTFKAKARNPTPWSTSTNTPEALLVHLPLPLHWHVQSLDSDVSFELDIPSIDVPPEDLSGQAKVHDEKNWAHSFPSAHMWLQARDYDNGRGFCCAGGQILGLEAFLLGYRSEDLNLDFRPPFAVRLAGLSPFMTYSTDWENRTFHLSVQSFRQKIEVKASAPKGTFFSLSAPFPEGFRVNYLGQSFNATIEVKVFESGWFGPWRLVREDRFEDASLEFGGGYYPPAGSAQRFN